MGGLAVGEKQNEMFKILKETTNLFPDSKPRYLMGVGTFRHSWSCKRGY